MMAPWIGALANKPIQEILDSITTGSLSFDLEQQKDKHIMGKVEQQMYEGRIVCKLVDFAPVGKVPF